MSDSPPAVRVISRPAARRLAPLLILLGVVLFPFEGLAARYPALDDVLGRAFPTDWHHAIGHATLFALLGFTTLLAIPALGRRPARYFGLLVLAGLGQELFQLAFKQRPPVFDDARDLVVDLFGLGLAFGVVWLLSHRDKDVRQHQQQ
jgi:hypothetical protein